MTSHDQGPTVGPQRSTSRGRRRARPASSLDDRLGLAGPMRKQLNKVFPDHWSFMMGEIALYSFIILLLTGTYLTFFFDPSMAEVVYHGSLHPAARASRCRGPTPRRCTSPSTCAAAWSSARSTTGRRCCSSAAMTDPHVPGVLHRRVPQAA